MKKIKVAFSKHKHGKVGLAGHIGVSHVNSHSGFVQEDGAGFSVVASVLNAAASIDLRISHIDANLKNNSVNIRLNSGGKGVAFAHSGITPAEKSLMKNAVGKSAVWPQTLATEIFGRVIGQGVLEVPSAFIAATSLAVVNSFLLHYPDQFIYAPDDMPLSVGCTIGTVLMINKTPVSTLMTINAGEGGIGPNEDSEGNVPIGNKRKLMEQLNLNRLPTIIVESKAFVPAWKDQIKETSLVVRANDIYDNTVVRECLVKSAKALGYPVFTPENPYPRNQGSLYNTQKVIAGQIVDLGKRLARAKTAKEKNLIAAKLASIIKNDLGGVTFMSNEVNDIFDHGGLLPGTAAVLSSAVTTDYVDKHKIPVLTNKDIKMYMNTIVTAFKLLEQRIDDAEKQILKKSVPMKKLESIEKKHVVQ